MMRKSVLMLALIGTIAGCSKGGGSNAAPAGPDNGKANPAATTADGSIGQFVSKTELPLEEYGMVPQAVELPKAKECETVGADKKQIRHYSYDSRLRVNDVFETAYESKTYDFSTSNHERRTVTAAAEKSIAFNVEFLNYKASNIAVEIPKSITGTYSCSTLATDTTDTTAQSETCENGPLSWDFEANAKPDVSQEIDCYGWSDKSVSGTAALGTYTMANGVSIAAQRVYTVRKNATIRCRRGNEGYKEIGSGTEEDIEISSVAVLNSGLIGCAIKPTVYSLRVVKKDDGTIISSVKSETIEAPVR